MRDCFVAGPSSGLVIIAILSLVRLDNIRPARLTIDVPFLRYENLFTAHRKGEAAITGATTKSPAPVLAVPLPRPSLGATAHLVSPCGGVVDIAKLESVGSHPRHEGFELAPACCDDAQTLDDAFNDGSLTEVVCWVRGLYALTGEGKLNNCSDGHTIGVSCVVSRKARAQLTTVWEERWRQTSGDASLTFEYPKPKQPLEP